MEFLHVKNLEKYHPGYKDRDLKWFKCYFRMVNADPEFEMLCEIDKWRFVALVMLELQYQKPIPLDDAYFKRKGFDLKKRSMSLTIKMLHNSVDVVTGDEKPRIDSVTQIREEEEKDKEEEKKKKSVVSPDEFLTYWNTKRLTRISGFNEQRKKQLKIRSAEQDFFDRWRMVIDKMDGSNFCRESNWATVDWVLKNSINYVKVLEGNYDNKGESTQQEKKTKLFPISGRSCSKDNCLLPAVYKSSGGAFDFYYCTDHMPESVKVKYA